jgi:hypothetical protein
MSTPSMRRSGGVIRRALHNAWGLSLWLGPKQDACAARAASERSLMPHRN